MNIIETSNLTKFYGQRVGVESMALTVKQGEVFGFLGPNGAGKTTTIRLLLGLLKATNGEARVLGLECWRESHRVKQSLGYVPGDLRLYPWMTARRAIWIAGKVRRQDLNSSGRQLAEQFQLELDVPVRKMSRGMKQKLGLILALAHDPQLLILDEPTSALDPLMQHMLYKLLQERAANGATVFFSSHTLSEVEGLCDRVAIVREGRLVANDTIASLRSQATREVSIDWESNPAAGHIDVPSFLKLRSRDRSQWRAELTGGAKQLLAWATTQPIADITIGQPDLQTLFRKYYE